MEGARGFADERRRQIIGITPTILGLLVLLSIHPAPVKARVQVQATTDWVEAVFPERSHDFGTVAKGSILRHSFRVMNRTNREVRITGSKPKCGCTDVTIGARTIPPGAQTTIEAVFDTSKFRGFKGSGLTITIDQPSVRTIDYELSCFIQDEIVVEPGVIDFGEVKRGSVPEQVVTLGYLGGQREWRVLDMRHSSRSLIAELREQPRTEAGTLRYRLVAKLDPKELRNGNFRDEITLVTNDPKRREIPLSVVAKVTSDITVTPAVLNLGSIKAGERAERTILIKGPAPFRVMGTTAVEGTIAAAGEPSDASKPLHQLRVSIEAPAVTGAYHAILEIRTDRPDEPPARLTAFATIVP